MRINSYIARATNLSRRAADAAIAEGRVTINGQPAELGTAVTDKDKVSLDGRLLKPRRQNQTIILHKPVGYVTSRSGQGSQTVYDLLPAKLHHLNPVGRLDKYTSGLLLMTDDGQLAQNLTHPSKQKIKVYEVMLDNELLPADVERITRFGIKLDDGISRFSLDYINDDEHYKWRVTMTEGRNRQIRRTFEALGYQVLDLHRTHFGPYKLGSLSSGKYKLIVV